VSSTKKSCFDISTVSLATARSLCAACRCHVTVDSRSTVTSPANEYRAVKVASHAPLTPGGRYRDDYMERCGLLAARCAFSAKSVVPELILLVGRVSVDSHGAGGGRNWADPVTRHRNTGCCSERVAHFFAVFMSRCGCAGGTTFCSDQQQTPMRKMRM